MSQTGKLIFFTETQPIEPVETLGRLITALGGRRIFLFGRTIGPDRSWEDFMCEAKDLGHTRFTREEQLDPQTPVERIPDFYRPATCLRIDFADSASASVHFYQAVELGIPELIRGRHIPGELIIRFGPHDIFEWFHKPEGQLIARAFVSVSMYGQFTPNDWPAYEEAIQELAAFSTLRQQIKNICGPVRHQYIWSI